MDIRDFTESLSTTMKTVSRSTFNRRKTAVQKREANYPKHYSYKLIAQNTTAETQTQICGITHYTLCFRGKNELVRMERSPAPESKGLGSSFSFLAV